MALTALAILGISQSIASFRLLAQGTDFAGARMRMVKEQLRARGITNAQVLRILGEVPRHKFVPEAFARDAYDDGPLPIGFGQTISQPYIVAFMTECLNPLKTDRVLEVGTGSGYQAAVLSGLVADVYSIEIITALAKQAGTTLSQLGYTNVHVRAGDGYQGWPEAAPFDAIMVTCAPENIPAPLVDQLKDGGRMIIPVGGRFSQELVLLRKTRGKMSQESVLPVRFVPMTRRPSQEP
ncbi:MAG TPA: protein-L-isoaspartate(D-aspartate) O-methyltransferase [Clostridia bacterium]|nr:protein-L-isoaspartate(D-aspartate) O-methyltransferase [Clostridia bacterium]